MPLQFPLPAHRALCVTRVLLPSRPNQLSDKPLGGQYRERSGPFSGRGAGVGSLLRCGAMRCVAFVGGWAHPASRTGPAVARALRTLGHDVVVATTFAAATSALSDDTVELLVVNTCRFQMTDARYTPGQRARYASVTPDDFRRAVSDHVGRNRPVLAQHTAALCFDDWAQWSNLIGARWDWARSNHPPLGSFVVDPTTVAGADRKSFTIDDELYRFVEPAKDTEILAQATDSDGVVHPVAWRRHHDQARVAYVSLGHDRRSLDNPDHQALLQQTIDWLGERS
jgi:uncharacterized protein